MQHLANKEAEIVIAGGFKAVSVEQVDRDESKIDFEAAVRFRDAIAVLREIAKDDYKFQVATFHTEPITQEIPEA